MSTQEHWITYYIVLSDPAQVKALQDQYETVADNGTTGIDSDLKGGQVGIPVYNPNGTPQPEGGDPAHNTDAVTLYNAPFKAGDVGLAQQAPYVYTPWIGDDNVAQFPLDVWTFSKKVGGFWGFGGTKHTYYWVGRFVYQAPKTPTVNQEPVGSGGTGVPAAEPIQKRRWIIGFEWPDVSGMSGLASGAHYDESCCFDASRHLGQRGLALRGGTQTVKAGLNLLDGTAASGASWERVYIRLRRPDPLTGTVFWRTHDSVSANQGCGLGITPAGKLGLFSINNLGTATLQSATIDIPIGKWTRLDMIVDNGAGSLTVYVNGILAGSSAFAAGALHASSEIGFMTACACELDVDDWINAEVPTTFGGADWLSGSKVAFVRATGLGAAANGFTGDWRSLLQIGVGGTTDGQIMTSTTPNAVLEVTTDADLTVDGDAGALGPVAMVVGVRSRRGTTSGQLGFTLAGAPAVLSAITELATESGEAAFWTTDGTLTDPPDVTPLTLQYVKGNDATACAVSALMAEVELIGSFDESDIRTTEAPDGVPTMPSAVGIHNTPYPRSPWALSGGAPPLSPVILYAGTYVGNGVAIDLHFNGPVHWFAVRQVGAGTEQGGARWWSTLQGSHPADDEAIEPYHVLRAEQNLAFQPAGSDETNPQQDFVLHIGGDPRSNGNGNTYQYIAVCDPGMRFMLNAQLQHDVANVNAEYDLPDGTFAAEGAWVWIEQFGAVTTPELGLKAVGQNADEFTLMSQSVKTKLNLASTGKVITDGNTLHSSSGIIVGLSLWRRDDGSGDPGVARVWTGGTYTGDGSATRTIALTPASQRRPLYAVFVSDSAGAAIFRDPSHTGTTSSNMTDAADNASTGIKAGDIDAITVGSALNANGVVYHYFVLFGGSDAGNNGWSGNGTFEPVDPGNAPGDGWGPTPDLPGTGQTPGEGEGDFSATCEPFTRGLVNIALSRIGVSKQVGDLVNDLTIEATVARLNVAADVDAVLRDFPWPFATAYADLVLVAGTPTVKANADWQYAYRVPANMMLARRIVGQADQRRRPEHFPVRFRVGSDATGDLIFCDASNADVPVTLEYTVRKDCPASEGDALFKDALAWRFAHSLAPALSRDPSKQKYCWARYLEALSAAERAGANEQQGHRPPQADWIDAREGLGSTLPPDPWGRD